MFLEFVFYIKLRLYYASNKFSTFTDTIYGFKSMKKDPIVDIC